jgi:hypothetical protein
MWIRELAIGWERVYKPSEHASASVTRGTRDAVPTGIIPLRVKVLPGKLIFKTKNNKDNDFFKAKVR